MQLHQIRHSCLVQQYVGFHSLARCRSVIACIQHSRMLFKPDRSGRLGKGLAAVAAEVQCSSWATVVAHSPAAHLSSVMSACKPRPVTSPEHLT